MFSSKGSSSRSEPGASRRNGKSSSSSSSKSKGKAQSDVAGPSSRSIKDDDQVESSRRSSSKRSSRVYSDDEDNIRSTSKTDSPSTTSNKYSSTRKESDRGVDSPKSSARKSSTRDPSSSNMASTVPNQFPDQAPQDFSLPYRPPMPTSGSFGAAADFYGDQGESVIHQPGNRPGTPIIMNAEPHLMPASAVANPVQDTGCGSAADFYAGNSATLPPATSVSALASRPQNYTQSQGSSTRPSRPYASGSSHSIGPAAAGIAAGSAASSYYASTPASPGNSSYATAPSASQSSRPSQKPSARPSRQSASTSSYSNSATLAGAAGGEAASYYDGSFSTETSTYATAPNGAQSSNSSQRPPARPSKQSSQHSSSVLPAAAIGAAGASAAAYAYHQKHHTNSTQQNSQNSYPPSNGGRPPAHPIPGSNYGAATFQSYNDPRRQKGPLGKFSDWWNNYEDVRKMEDYTEYIGVCRYCFGSQDSLVDAPRKHRPTRKRSREFSHRVDKESRYARPASPSSSSSDVDGFGKGFIGAGLAGLGLAAAASKKSSKKQQREFDDYSVNTGDIDGRMSVSDARRRRSRTDLTNERPAAIARRSSVRFQSDEDSNRRRRRSSPTSRFGTGSAVAAGAVAATAAGYALKESSRRKSKSRRDSIYDDVGTDEVDTSRRQSKRRDSSSSSSASSVGIWGKIFSPRSKKEKRKPKSKASVYSGKLPASSTVSDLAYGVDLPKVSRKSSRRRSRSSSPMNATKAVAGLGTAAALLAAADSRRNKRAEGQSEVFAVREPRQPMLGRQRRQSPAYSRKAERASDDGWEDLSDSDDASSISAESAMAFGANSDASRSSSSVDSMDAQSAQREDWRYALNDDRQPFDQFQMPSSRRASSQLPSTTQTPSKRAPLQSVDPIPLSNIPSQFDTTPARPLRSAVKDLPLQQPQPITRVKPPSPDKFDYQPAKRSKTDEDRSTFAGAGISDFVPSKPKRSSTAPIADDQIRSDRRRNNSESKAESQQPVTGWTRPSRKGDRSDQDGSVINPYTTAGYRQPAEEPRRVLTQEDRSDANSRNGKKDKNYAKDAVIAAGGAAAMAAAAFAGSRTMKERSPSRERSDSSPDQYHARRERRESEAVRPSPSTQKDNTIAAAASKPVKDDFARRQRDEAEQLANDFARREREAAERQERMRQPKAKPSKSDDNAYARRLQAKEDQRLERESERRRDEPSRNIEQVQQPKSRSSQSRDEGFTRQSRDEDAELENDFRRRQDEAIRRQESIRKPRYETIEPRKPSSSTSGAKDLPSGLTRDNIGAQDPDLPGKFIDEGADNKARDLNQDQSHGIASFSSVQPYVQHVVREAGSSKPKVDADEDIFDPDLFRKRRRSSLIKSQASSPPAVEEATHERDAPVEALDPIHGDYFRPLMGPRTASGSVPVISIINPTPPLSIAGSAIDPHSRSNTPLREVATVDDDQSEDELPVDLASRRKRRVTWGEDQTSIYQVQTPESIRDEYFAKVHTPEAISKPSSSTKSDSPGTKISSTYQSPRVEPIASPDPPEFSIGPKGDAVETLMDFPILSSVPDQPAGEGVDFPADSPVAKNLINKKPEVMPAASAVTDTPSRNIEGEMAIPVETHTTMPGSFGAESEEWPAKELTSDARPRQDFGGSSQGKASADEKVEPSVAETALSAAAGAGAAVVGAAGVMNDWATGSSKKTKKKNKKRESADSQVADFPDRPLESDDHSYARRLQAREDEQLERAQSARGESPSVANDDTESLADDKESRVSSSSKSSKRKSRDASSSKSEEKSTGFFGGLFGKGSSSSEKSKEKDAKKDEDSASTASKKKRSSKRSSTADDASIAESRSRKRSGSSSSKRKTKSSDRQDSVDGRRRSSSIPRRLDDEDDSGRRSQVPVKQVNTSALGMEGTAGENALTDRTQDLPQTKPREPQRRGTDAEENALGITLVASPEQEPANSDPHEQGDYLPLSQSIDSLVDLERSNAATGPTSEDEIPDYYSEVPEMVRLPRSRPESPYDTQEPAPAAQTSEVKRVTAASPQATSTSKTAIPLKFRPPPSSPLPHSDLTVAQSPKPDSPQEPSSPTSRRLPRSNRPASADFKSSREFRPLFLPSKYTESPKPDHEETLPSLPSSRTSSVVDSDDGFESAVSSQRSSPNVHARDADFLDWHETAEPEYLDSQQATPKAGPTSGSITDVPKLDLSKIEHQGSDAIESTTRDPQPATSSKEQNREETRDPPTTPPMRPRSATSVRRSSDKTRTGVAAALIGAVGGALFANSRKDSPEASPRTTTEESPMSPSSQRFLERETRSDERAGNKEEPEVLGAASEALRISKKGKKDKGKKKGRPIPLQNPETQIRPSADAVTHAADSTDADLEEPPLTAQRSSDASKPDFETTTSSSSHKNPTDVANRDLPAEQSALHQPAEESYTPAENPFKVASRELYGEQSAMHEPASEMSSRHDSPINIASREMHAGQSASQSVVDTNQQRDEQFASVDVVPIDALITPLPVDVSAEESATITKEVSNTAETSNDLPENSSAEVRLSSPQQVGEEEEESFAWTSKPVKNSKKAKKAKKTRDHIEDPILESTDAPTTPTGITEDEPMPSEPSRGASGVEAMDDVAKLQSPVIVAPEAEDEWAVPAKTSKKDMKKKKHRSVAEADLKDQEELKQTATEAPAIVTPEVEDEWPSAAKSSKKDKKKKKQRSIAEEDLAGEESKNQEEITQTTVEAPVIVALQAEDEWVVPAKSSKKDKKKKSKQFLSLTESPTDNQVHDDSAEPVLTSEAPEIEEETKKRASAISELSPSVARFNAREPDESPSVARFNAREPDESTSLDETSRGQIDDIAAAVGGVSSFEPSTKRDDSSQTQASEDRVPQDQVGDAPKDQADEVSDDRKDLMASTFDTSNVPMMPNADGVLDDREDIVASTPDTGNVLVMPDTDEQWQANEVSVDREDMVAATPDTSNVLTMPNASEERKVDEVSVDREDEVSATPDTSNVLTMPNASEERKVDEVSVDREDIVAATPDTSNVLTMPNGSEEPQADGVPVDREDIMASTSNTSNVLMMPNAVEEWQVPVLNSKKSKKDKKQKKKDISKVQNLSTENPDESEALVREVAQDQDTQQADTVEKHESKVSSVAEKEIEDAWPVPLTSTQSKKKGKKKLRSVGFDEVPEEISSLQPEGPAAEQDNAPTGEGHYPVQASTQDAGDLWSASSAKSKKSKKKKQSVTFDEPVDESSLRSADNREAAEDVTTPSSDDFVSRAEGSNLEQSDQPVAAEETREATIPEPTEPWAPIDETVAIGLEASTTALSTAGIDDEWAIPAPKSGKSKKSKGKQRSVAFEDQPSSTATPPSNPAKDEQTPEIPSIEAILAETATVAPDDDEWAPSTTKTKKSKKKQRAVTFEKPPEELVDSKDADLPVTENLDRGAALADTIARDSQDGLETSEKSKKDKKKKKAAVQAYEASEPKEDDSKAQSKFREGEDDALGSLNVVEPEASNPEASTSTLISPEIASRENKIPEDRNDQDALAPDDEDDALALIQDRRPSRTSFSGTDKDSIQGDTFAAATEQADHPLEALGSSELPFGVSNEMSGQDDLNDPTISPAGPPDASTKDIMPAEDDVQTTQGHDTTFENVSRSLADEPDTRSWTENIPSVDHDEPNEDVVDDWHNAENTPNTDGLLPYNEPEASPHSENAAFAAHDKSEQYKRSDEIEEDKSLPQDVSKDAQRERSTLAKTTLAAASAIGAVGAMGAAALGLSKSSQDEDDSTVRALSQKDKKKGKKAQHRSEQTFEEDATPEPLSSMETPSRPNASNENGMPEVDDFDSPLKSKKDKKKAKKAKQSAWQTEEDDQPQQTDLAEQSTNQGLSSTTQDDPTSLPEADPETSIPLEAISAPGVSTDADPETSNPHEAPEEDFSFKPTSKKDKKKAKKSKQASWQMEDDEQPKEAPQSSSEHAIEAEALFMPTTYGSAFATAAADDDVDTQSKSKKDKKKAKKAKQVSWQTGDNDASQQAEVLTEAQPELDSILQGTSSDRDGQPAVMVGGASAFEPEPLAATEAAVEDDIWQSSSKKDKKKAKSSKKLRELSSEPPTPAEGDADLDITDEPDRSARTVPQDEAIGPSQDVQPAGIVEEASAFELEPLAIPQLAAENAEIWQPTSKKDKKKAKLSKKLKGLTSEQLKPTERDVEPFPKDESSETGATVLRDEAIASPPAPEDSRLTQPPQFSLDSEIRHDDRKNFASSSRTDLEVGSSKQESQQNDNEQVAEDSKGSDDRKSENAAPPAESKSQWDVKSHTPVEPNDDAEEDDFAHRSKKDKKKVKKAKRDSARAQVQFEEAEQVQDKAIEEDSTEPVRHEDGQHESLADHEGSESHQNAPPADVSSKASFRTREASDVEDDEWEIRQTSKREKKKRREMEESNMDALLADSAAELSRTERDQSANGERQALEVSAEPAPYDVASEEQAQELPSAVGDPSTMRDDHIEPLDVIADPIVPKDEVEDEWSGFATTKKDKKSKKAKKASSQASTSVAPVAALGAAAVVLGASEASKKDTVDAETTNDFGWGDVPGLKKKKGKKGKRTGNFATETDDVPPALTSDLKDVDLGTDETTLRQRAASIPSIEDMLRETEPAMPETKDAGQSSRNIHEDTNNEMSHPIYTVTESSQALHHDEENSENVLTTIAELEEPRMSSRPGVEEGKSPAVGSTRVDGDVADIQSTAEDYYATDKQHKSVVEEAKAKAEADGVLAPLNPDASAMAPTTEGQEAETDITLPSMSRRKSKKEKADMSRSDLIHESSASRSIDEDQSAREVPIAVTEKIPSITHKQSKKEKKKKGKIQSVPFDLSKEGDHAIATREDQTITTNSPTIPDVSQNDTVLSRKISRAGSPSQLWGAKSKPSYDEDDGPLAIRSANTDDVDFAATLAAGLEDSGFNPNLVTENLHYHKRTTPPASTSASRTRENNMSPDGSVMRQRPQEEWSFGMLDDAEAREATPVREHITGPLDEDPDTSFDDIIARGLDDAGFERGAAIASTRSVSGTEATERMSSRGMLAPGHGSDEQRLTWLEKQTATRASSRSFEQEDAEERGQAVAEEPAQPIVAEHEMPDFWEQEDEQERGKSVQDDPIEFTQTSPTKKNKEKKSKSRDSTANIAAASTAVAVGAAALSRGTEHDSATPKGSKRKGKKNKRYQAMDETHIETPEHENKLVDARKQTEEDADRASHPFDDSHAVSDETEGGEAHKEQEDQLATRATSDGAFGLREPEHIRDSGYQGSQPGTPEIKSFKFEDRERTRAVRPGLSDIPDASPPQSEAIRREPSPVKSTSKDRSSALFNSSPGQSRDEDSAPVSRSPTPTPEDTHTIPGLEELELGHGDDPSDFKSSQSRAVSGGSELEPIHEFATEDEQNLDSLQPDFARLGAGSNRGYISPNPSEIANTRRRYRRSSSIESAEHMRPLSALSARSRTPGSAISQRSGTPTLHRSMPSSDLGAEYKRGLAQDDPQHPASSNLSKPSESSRLSSYDPLKGTGRDRRQMSSDRGIYEGYGDVQDSPRSTSRPQSLRKRQSTQLLEFENRIDQLTTENNALRQGGSTSRDLSGPPSQFERTLRARDEQLREKDVEINSIRVSLSTLQEEVSRVSEHNATLRSAHDQFSSNTDERSQVLEAERDHAHSQWQGASRELDQLRDSHSALQAGIGATVSAEIAKAMSSKDTEIAKLRAQLTQATNRIRTLQSEIMASKSGTSFLNTKDTAYFASACAQLFTHVQGWVVRFSKFSDMRVCRSLSELRDDTLQDRFDYAILDGTEAEDYLNDRTARRDVFMSVLMALVWEFVFTRYLFGMDREQRQKLKQLEKILSEVGPTDAVAQWRATTLTLLSRRPAFNEQRERDTEAVVQEVYRTLSAVLPPPQNLKAQIQDSLRNLMRLAVDLSIDMRTQREEYMMLPPLKPEWDTNGALKEKVPFQAKLMVDASKEDESAEDLARRGATVRLVLFPIVVRRGRDENDEEVEDTVYRAQVIASREMKKKVRHGLVPGRNASQISMAPSMAAPSAYNGSVGDMV